MRDEPERTTPWQFSLRSMLAATALVAFCGAVAKTWHPVLVCGGVVVGSLWGSVEARRRFRGRVAVSAKGGAIGGGLTGGLILFFLGLVSGPEIIAYPPGVDKGPYLALVWLILGGYVGAVMGLIVGACLGRVATFCTRGRRGRAARKTEQNRQ